MQIIRPHIVGAVLAAAAVVLSLGAVASSAEASTIRHPVAPPVATTTPTATPAPAAPPAAAPIPATGTVTHLGTNFSAGGYASVNYLVTTATSGTYTVRYTVDIAGSAVNTKVDGVALNQISVSAGAPVTTNTFTLSAGTHTIGTQSPDGYGSTSIDLVRVG